MSVHTFKYTGKPNQLATLYQTLSPSRVNLLTCLSKNSPTSIQQLARLLNRDYAIV